MKIDARNRKPNAPVPHSAFQTTRQKEKLQNSANHSETISPT